MAEECSHECGSCGVSGCGERTAAGPTKLETNKRSNVKHVIGVVSGKGGVGKSLVTSLLASEMNKRGNKVGILDADITGPSIPKKMCIRDRRCRYQRPTGLATTFSIRSPAAPALVGLPLPHRCTCKLTRPGIKYAPFKSTSCAPAGPTVEAAGPTALMRPLSSTATVIFS